MAPTQSTVVAAQTGQASEKPAEQSHQVSVPAMVVLALFLVMMAALAIGVTLRHRRAMAAKRRHTQEKVSSARSSWSPLSRFRSKPTGETPTAVGALHAASVLVAAAPTKMFPSSMTMHFRTPLQDKTVLVLGTPWLSAQCGPQLSSAPANRQTDVQCRHCCDFAPRSPRRPECTSFDDSSWDHLHDFPELHSAVPPPPRPPMSEAHSYQLSYQVYHGRSRSHPTELSALTPLTNGLPPSSTTSRKHRVGNWEDLPVLCVKLP
ncbi:hypothetical protein BDN67DRAFT_973424 [Paxillus ammoniavirescens]|nr:hypothetical protein BDN67DRAFT_973424 [Paxillus ammoniavirescens]